MSQWSANLYVDDTPDGNVDLDSFRLLTRDEAKRLEILPANHRFPPGNDGFCRSPKGFD